MTYKTLKTNFEREILFQIIFNMKQKRMSTKKAKQIARVVLQEVRKEHDEASFLQNIAKLSESFPEVMEAFIKSASEYEKEFQTERIASVQKSLNEIMRGGEN